MSKLAHLLSQRPPSRILDQAKEAVQRNRDTHTELVQVMRTILRPGGFVQWSTLRRTLTLVGYRRYAARTWAIMLAILDTWPHAESRRPGHGVHRPRGIHGVRLQVNLEAMRKAVAGKWESKLPPAEVTPTPTEYKTPLELAPKGSRLAELVQSARHRQEEASRYYSVVSRYLHVCKWSEFPKVHKRIWELHCEGATKEQISEETRTAPTTVQDAIQLHRARAGVVQT